MMKSLTLLLVVTCLFIASPVMADDIYVRGEEILNACDNAIKYMDKTGNADSFQSGICWGYLAGANDMHELMDHGEDAPHHCMPKEKNISELARAVVNYLKANPEKIGNPASILVFDAYHEAFPCDNNPPPA